METEFRKILKVIEISKERFTCEFLATVTGF